MNNLKTNITNNESASTNLNYNLPILFNIKSKTTISKPLTYIKSDTGKTRHYTPAAQEWYNSVYSYNANYIKTLPAADKNLMNLLKSYFNFQLNQKLSITNTKRTPLRFKRLSTKKVFIGRGELKHTSNKVLITFYVLNTEGMFLASSYNKLKHALIFTKKKLERFVNYDREGKVKITYNRPFTIHEYSSRVIPLLYSSHMMYIINKSANSEELDLLNIYYESLTNLVETNLLTEEEKHIMFSQKVANWKPLNSLNINEFWETKIEDYKKELNRSHFLLRLNKMRFTTQFMSKLVVLVKKLYNKNVEFNIVNLKKMHLNSDIFTQAVSLKLKNRENKLYRVLKTSLRKIKLPVIRKISEKLNKPNKDEFMVNRIRNSIINSMFINNNTKDSLNNLLLSFYPAADDLKISVIKRFSIKRRKISLKGFVFRHHLKHLKLRGVRLEAKGRLTRRATASRSVFKMRLKGGLKNVDSSFRGLSAILLRGFLKSNLQYSVINSKNRNGAFGVKGWVSSK